MSSRDIVVLSDDEDAPVDTTIKLEQDCVVGTMQQKFYYKDNPAEHQKSKSQPRKHDTEEKKSSNALSTDQSSHSVLEQGQCPMDDTGISSTSSICPAPLCRQFWKAGNYEEGLGSKVTLHIGKSFLHVHPMFLHSNATSHKWAFGAVAELIDNSFDEIQNGATFVIIDKITNPRDGSPVLVIQDDGGGMDSEAMRRCMSFGFSDKKSKSAIGQYGNGFKTSSMRLGADVIVFSRHLDNRTWTQSIGLLSYTFLTRTGHDRIIVPMVDYEFNTSAGTFNASRGREQFMSNLSVILQWSPYSSEPELLKLFDDIGSHGTKVIIYNLWFSDDRKMELDFDTDPEDIRIGGDIINKFDQGTIKPLHEQHFAKRFHHSLRAYLSILYLRIPESFSIILRGKVIEHHNIANDLKYPNFILYRPQSGGCVEGTVITTIGFLKDAPHVSIHGFNVYHKNRLILPYWQVVSYSYRDSRGRGVVGVLEANFVVPTHNKQEFERTSLFQKLETRLKEMTWEYWDLHCGLIGYQGKRKPQVSISRLASVHSTPPSSIHQPVLLNQISATVCCTKPPVALPNSSFVEREELSILNTEGAIGQRSHKRKECRDALEFEKVKLQARKGVNMIDGVHSVGTQPVVTMTNQPRDPETIILMQENNRLRTKCLEDETRKVELELKVTHLRNELGGFNRECERLMAELKALDAIKEEKEMKIL